MNIPEVQNALDTLTLLVDTREQDTPRFRKRMSAVCLPYVRQKLDFGDYSARITMPNGVQRDFAQDFAIERKMSIDELAQNLTRGRARFEREFFRARKAGAKIYLLVEGADWDKIYTGRYRTKMHPNALSASMVTWLARYHCQIIMCPVAYTPNLIGEIVKKEAREILMREVESDVNE